MSLIIKLSRRRSTNIVVGSIVRTYLEYSEDEKDFHPFRKLQGASLIAQEAPINIPVKYANFTDVFSLILGSTNMLSNWLMPMDLSDYLNHPQVLPSFDRKSDRSLRLYI